jgi:hypothetical protein
VTPRASTHRSAGFQHGANNAFSNEQGRAAHKTFIHANQVGRVTPCAPFDPATNPERGSLSRSNSVTTDRSGITLSAIVAPTSLRVSDPRSASFNPHSPIRNSPTHEF